MRGKITALLAVAGLALALAATALAVGHKAVQHYIKVNGYPYQGEMLTVLDADCVVTSDPDIFSCDVRATVDPYKVIVFDGALVKVIGENPLVLQYCSETPC